MSSANDRQVGGSHYQSAYQHWDWSLDVELNPMQYQITKYLRARKKNGVQDMEKIRHFLQKYAEQVESGRRYPPSRIAPFMREVATSVWLKENGHDELESQVALDIVMRDHDPAVIRNLMHVVDAMIVRYQMDKAAEPGPGYVAQ